MELYYTSKGTAMNQYNVSTTESLGYGSSGMATGGPVAPDTAPMEWSQIYDSSASHYSQQQSGPVYSHYQMQPYQVGDQRPDQPLASTISSSGFSQVPVTGHFQGQFARTPLNPGDGSSGSTSSWSGGPDLVGPVHGMHNDHGSGFYAQNLLKQQLMLANSDKYTSESTANDYRVEMQGYGNTATSSSKPVHFGQRTVIQQPRIQSIAPGTRSGAATAHHSQVRQSGTVQSYGSVPRGSSLPFGTAAGRGVARASAMGPRPPGTAGTTTSRLNLIQNPRATAVSTTQSVIPTTHGMQSSNPDIPPSSCNKETVAATNESGASGASVTEKQNMEEKEKEEEEEDDDSDDDIDMNCCKLCDIKFEKAQAYHVHIRSTSHHQRVEAKKKEKMKLMGIDPSSSSSTSTTTTITSMATTSSDPKKDDHYCYVCNFPFSNAEVFNSHLQGLLHLRRLEEQKKATMATLDEEFDEEGQDSSSFVTYKKGDWMSANEKDLNPDDIGRPGSALYTCDVCNVNCTGLKSYEMHIAGAKHLKKLKKAKELEEFEEKKKQGMVADDFSKLKKKRKILRVQETLDLCSEPLVGLDYMTEFQFEDMTVEPRYICDLCQSKMDGRQVIAHVTGIKHRQKYFKFHSIRMYNILWDIRRKSDKVKAAKKFAAETEACEGRHSMRLKVQLTPFDDKSKAKEDEEWTEVESSHSRARSALPGLLSYEELSSNYQDVQDGEEEDEEEDGDVNKESALDVADQRRPIHQPPAGQGSVYRPPPSLQIRPYRPGPPERPPPRYPYPSPYRANPVPRYPPDRRHSQEPPSKRPAMVRSDPYYQRYPGYDQGDYNYPRPSSAASSFPTSSSNNLERRAVINYDHQSLTKDEDRYGHQSATRDETGSTGQRILKSEDRKLPEDRRNLLASASDNSSKAVDIDLIKTAIARCNIDTEADAELALQISNCLTQALLEFRLNSLAKAGSRDPALEQHLKNLREQNAELLTIGQHPQTSNFMYSALQATRNLAARIPEGDQETIKLAMSVLDAVNLQLYGMLGKNDDSKKSEETQKLPGTSQQNQQQNLQAKETNPRQYFYSEERNERTPTENRSALGGVAAAVVRPPSKRFHFGL